jgi:hypothetical protein
VAGLQGLPLLASVDVAPVLGHSSAPFVALSHEARDDWGGLAEWATPSGDPKLVTGRLLRPAPSGCLRSATFKEVGDQIRDLNPPSVEPLPDTSDGHDSVLGSSENADRGAGWYIQLASHRAGARERGHLTGCKHTPVEVRPEPVIGGTFQIDR